MSGTQYIGPFTALTSHLGAFSVLTNLAASICQIPSETGQVFVRHWTSYPFLPAEWLHFCLRRAPGATPETRAVNVVDIAVRCESLWPLSSPPSPLCSLSFIHCHRGFSSRSQTCLPYVIFSFSIRTLFLSDSGQG